MALLKRVGIGDGLITVLSILGVSVFLLVGGGWKSQTFLRYLLYALTAEGLVMALIGCLSFFGFEKYRNVIREYRNWSKGEETSSSEEKDKNAARTQSEDEAKPGIGLVLLVSGILLFISAFALLSLEP